MNANDDSSASVSGQVCEKRRDKWKRHEFVDFLMEKRVSAALADVVLELCRAKERPADPLEFIRTRMRPVNDDLAEIQSYRQKIEDLGTRVDELLAERNLLLELKRQIQLKYARQRCDDADDSGTTDEDASG